ncbi:MAG: hypothetical protein LBE16_06835 [Clostridiales Family XIII bacterium]|jgi:uncharacterized protein YukE|nr:hypothetical protein [Clostridiales Family XIII bacterium]
MAKLIMDTASLMNGSGDAEICLESIKGAFDDIRGTAAKLNDVWDDEAQRIFMAALDAKTKRILTYADELKHLLGDVYAAAAAMSDWDLELSGKLSDPRLGKTAG